VDPGDERELMNLPPRWRRRKVGTAAVRVR
jgi:hypothetical protein